MTSSAASDTDNAKKRASGASSRDAIDHSKAPSPLHVNVDKCHVGTEPLDLHNGVVDV